MGAHIINRQVIDLSVRSKENAFAIQQRVREIYFTEVVPLLDQVMSSITTSDEMLYIDRLEVDLGVLNYDQLSKEMIEGIRKQIVTQLNEQVRAAVKDVSVATAQMQDVPVLKTKARSDLELLRIFFTTGAIPWWADDEQSPPDTDEVILRVLKSEPDALLAILRKIIPQPAVVQRLLFQVNGKVMQQLISPLPKNVVQQVRRVVLGLAALTKSQVSFVMSVDQGEQLVFIAALSAYAEADGVSAAEPGIVVIRAVIERMSLILALDSKYVEQNLYRNVLLLLIRTPQPVEVVVPMIRYFEKWEQEQPARAIEVSGDPRLSVTAFIRQNASDTGEKIPEKLIARFLEKHENPRPAAKRKTKSKTEPQSIGRTDLSSQEVKEEPIATGTNEDLAELPEEIRALLDPGERITPEKEEAHLALTRYAGLVLLAPFLPAFFEEMQLLENGMFRSESEQHKAIHFLNFMATNKTKAPEYALALHKVLCAAEVTAPVPRNMKLTTAEKKATALFLDDIAEQWTALRGTSGEAFRETFMRRNGIIEQRVNALLMRIERAPMDVMLETLPWNISIIRLPWMQQLLHVEW